MSAQVCEEIAAQQHIAAAASHRMVKHHLGASRPREDGRPPIVAPLLSMPTAPGGGNLDEDDIPQASKDAIMTFLKGKPHMLEHLRRFADMPNKRGILNITQGDIDAAERQLSREHGRVATRLETDPCTSPESTRAAPEATPEPRIEWNGESWWNSTEWEAWRETGISVESKQAWDSWQKWQ